MINQCMNLSLRPVRRDEVAVVEDFGDYVVIFNSLTAETIGFNRSGLEIWKEIDGKKTLGDISDVIAKRFFINRDIAAVDVLNLIGRLHRRMFVFIKGNDNFSLDHWK